MTSAMATRTTPGTMGAAAPVLAAHAPEAAGEQEARADAEQQHRPVRHPALERVAQQEARAQAEQDSRRDDRPPELPQGREGQEDRPDQEQDRARPAEMERPIAG